MSNQIFPHISGIGFSVKRTPKFNNLDPIDSANPGWGTTVRVGSDKLTRFEFEYVVLTDAAKGQTLKQIEGFFNLRGGNADSFLVDVSKLTGNPADASVTGQVLTPDSYGYAPLAVGHYVSTSETYYEPIYELQGSYTSPVTHPTLYMGGTPMTYGTDYTIVGPGASHTGASYPGLVAIITRSITGTVTADLSWYYRCRFEQAAQDFDMFSYLLWKCKQMTLTQWRV